MFGAECDEAFSIIQMLVLRGAPLRLDGVARLFYHGYESRRFDLLINSLLARIDAELHTTRTFVALVLGCGVHASHDLPPAQRCQLMKLRGDGNTDARQRIARCLGVRTSRAELTRLQSAAEACRAPSIQAQAIAEEHARANPRARF